MLIFLYLLLSSCSIGPNKDTVFSVATPENVFDISQLDCIENISTLSLDIQDNFHNVSELMLIEESLFIQTDKGLYKYGLDGSFVTEISKRGRASNEWQSLDCFSLTPDRKMLCIFDNVGQKVLYYNLQGDFLCYKDISESSIRDAYSYCPYGGNSYLACQRVRPEKTNLFFKCSDDFSVQENYYETLFCTNGTLDVIGDRPISCFSDNYHVVVPFDYSIYCIDDNGMYPEYELPVLGKKLKQKSISRIRDFSLFKSFELKCQGYDVGYSSIFETSRFIVLPYYNYEYLIIDKSNLTSTLFCPEQMYSDTSIVSFYYIKESNNDTLISVDNQGLDNSDKLRVIFYTLKK